MSASRIVAMGTPRSRIGRRSGGTGRTLGRTSAPTAFGPVVGWRRPERRMRPLQLEPDALPGGIDDDAVVVAQRAEEHQTVARPGELAVEPSLLGHARAAVDDLDSEP